MSDLKKILQEINYLNEKIYEDEPCGGLLHIVLDDGNVLDRDLVYSFRYVNDADEIQPVKDMYLKLLTNLCFLTYAQRVVWWADSKVSEDILISVADGEVVEDKHCYRAVFVEGIMV